MWLILIRIFSEVKSLGKVVMWLGIIVDVKQILEFTGTSIWVLNLPVNSEGSFVFSLWLKIKNYFLKK